MFEDDYVFPDGFFKGLTVAEARERIPEMDARIAEWNEQVEAAMIQFEKEQQEIDAILAEVDEHYKAIMAEAQQ